MKQETRKNRRGPGKKDGANISIPASGGSAIRRWSAPLLLAVLCVLLYGNSLQNDFAFDDKPLIVKNEAIRSFGNIPDILGISDPRNFIDGLIGGVNYRPIRVVSFTIDYFFSGSSPIAYHVFNIIYHFLTAWVVFLVVVRLMNTIPGWIPRSSVERGSERESLVFRTALFTAVLFAVHPIQTNAVTYISGRRDILSTLFYMLAFLYFLKLREVQKGDAAVKGPRVAYFSLVCLFFILAIYTKEMALSLPGVFFIVDFMREFPDRRGGRLLIDVLQSAGRAISRHRRFYYPIIVISLLTAMHYMFFRGASDRVAAGWRWWGDSALSNFLTAATVLVYYIKLMLFPVVLIADYSYNAYPIARSLWEPRVLFSIAVLVILAVIAARWLRRDRVLAFGCIWFFVTLLPVSQIIPHHELLAEHYLYLPSIGFCMLVSWMLVAVMSRAPGNRGAQAAGYAALALLVVLWSARTIVRNPDWRSDRVLWAKTTRTVPDSYRAQFNMGNLLRQEGSLYKALEHLNLALKIKPNDARALVNVGAIYDRMGLKDKAVDQYRKALLADPEYAAALNNLGAAYIARGELDKAIDYLKNALRLSYDFMEARLNLATAYGKKFYTEDALKQFDIALEMDSDNGKIYYYRGLLFDSIEEHALARRDIRLAIIHDPNSPLTHLKMGELYVAEKKMDEAAREFEEVVRLEPRIAQAHANLATIFAQKGEVEKALVHFKTALDIDPNMASAHKGMAIIYLTYFQDLDGAIFHFRRTLELDPKQENADGIRQFLANPGLTLPEKLPETQQGGG